MLKMGKHTHAYTHTHTHTHSLQIKALTSIQKHVSNDKFHAIVHKYYFLGVKNLVLYHSLQFTMLYLGNIIK